MVQVKVVELRERSSDNTVVPLIRFVLTDEGIVRVVELATNALVLVEQPIQRGIPGRDRLLRLQDGIKFLERLPQLYSGTSLWATEVFEMEEDQALKGHDENRAERGAS